MSSAPGTPKKTKEETKEPSSPMPSDNIMSDNILGVRRSESRQRISGVQPYTLILKRPATQPVGDRGFYFRQHKESEPEYCKELDLDALPAGKVSVLWLELVRDGLGQPVNIPIMVAKGSKPGPVFGLTAALHGDELSGMPVIHGVFHDIASRCDQLRGTILAVPVCNPFGYHLQQREYLDGQDLNRLMPGKKEGNIGNQFAYHLFNKVIKKMTHLIDFHTASEHHTNSLYVRADLLTPATRRMAELMRCEIMLHNRGTDQTLRSNAMMNQIPAICVEVGNPSLFASNGYLNRTYVGVFANLVDLKILDPDPAFDKLNAAAVAAVPKPVVCSSSYWIYTAHGGVLTVPPGLKDLVTKGQEVAIISDVFGYITHKQVSNDDGIVIGKSTSPSNHQGDRVIHLGIIDHKFAQNNPNVDDI